MLCFKYVTYINYNFSLSISILETFRNIQLLNLQKLFSEYYVENIFPQQSNDTIPLIFNQYVINTNSLYQSLYTFMKYLFNSVLLIN